MKDIFEDVREWLGCAFISDIRISSNRDAAAKRASHLNIGDYPLSQWEDFVSYIFNEKRHFSSEADVTAFFSERVG